MLESWVPVISLSGRITISAGVSVWERVNYTITSTGYINLSSRLKLAIGVSARDSFSNFFCGTLSHCQLKIEGLGSIAIAGHATVVATNLQGADVQLGQGEVAVALL